MLYDSIFYRVPRVVRFTETESGMVVARGWWRGNVELLFTWYSVSFREDEKSWRRIVVMVAQLCDCAHCHWTAHLEMVMPKSVLPVFSSNSLIVASLTFRLLINFEFIFVFSVRECSNFIHLHVADQCYLHHLLKRLPFFYCILLPPLS